MAQNIRRSISDSYDPKQRIVGGIVLFLLMLLLYLVLKIILGISSSLHDNSYILREQIFEEPTLSDIYEETTDKQKTDVPSVPVSNSTDSVNTGTENNSSAVKVPNKPNRLLPGGFVFLDIKGNPMQTETYQTTEQGPQKTEPTPTEGTRWVVQAGSFFAEDRAQRMVEELKGIGVNSEIVKIDKWFTVRLIPQRDRREAEQQLRQLRQTKNIKGLIKKIE